MAFINYINKEINAKIVYYGPGLSGKTTNILYIHKKLTPESRGKLVSLATQTDRTLFFDFLPISIGEINGFKVRFHLYTVPGQIFYNTTRKMVLKGVDGVVFVADSQKQMLEDNIESLKNLEDNLNDYGIDINSIPMVIQYNKRDLENAMDLEELHHHLNKRKVPFFPAVAVEGKGVLESLMTICKMVIKKLKELQKSDKENAEDESESKTQFQAEDKRDYLPEDYSDTALEVLDGILKEDITEDIKEEKSEVEDIISEIEELETEQKEEINITDINKDIFEKKAITAESITEEINEDKFNISIDSPSIKGKEVELPIKLTIGDKEKSVKIRLKIEIEE